MGQDVAHNPLHPPVVRREIATPLQKCQDICKRAIFHKLKQDLRAKLPQHMFAQCVLQLGEAKYKLIDQGDQLFVVFSQFVAIKRKRDALHRPAHAVSMAITLTQRVL